MVQGMVNSNGVFTNHYTSENLKGSNDNIIATLTEYFNYTADQDCLLGGTALFQSGVSAAYVALDGTNMIHTYSSETVSRGDFGMFVPKGTVVSGYTHSTITVYSMNV